MSRNGSASQPARRLRISAWARVAYAAVLTACSQPPGFSAPHQAQSAAAGPPVSLAINGFNYTDTVISEFYVNGQGGGNVYVSSPTSGGGKTSCCVVWHPIKKLPTPIKIEWLRVVDGRDRWCEKTVQLNGPIPDKPTAFGVHFMPDGDIQVEVTRGESDPRLKLDRFSAAQRHESGNVVHDAETARCKDGR